jgi:hypothetical protein
VGIAAARCTAHRNLGSASAHNRGHSNPGI